VPGAADLEEDLALVFELDFLVVDAPRQQHASIHGQELVAGQLRARAACAPFGHARLRGAGRTGVAPVHDGFHFWVEL
jgi:hypothetical protein